MLIIVDRYSPSRRIHPPAIGILVAKVLSRENETMRFVVIATTVASMIGVPLAVNAANPQMNSAEFLSAVQCVAYESAASPGAADLGAARWRLNAEAGKQSAEVAALARARAQAISAAVNAGAPVAQLSCGSSRIADAADNRRGV
jgi:hypothetical protein